MDTTKNRQNLGVQSQEESGDTAAVVDQISDSTGPAEDIRSKQDQVKWNHNKTISLSGAKDTLLIIKSKVEDLIKENKTELERFKSIKSKIK